MNVLKSGDVIAHYELQEMLGSGRLGEVYRARDTLVGREVAIKVLARDLAQDPEALEIMRAEARAIAQVHHPAVATLFGVEELHGEWCLVLEYVDGPTLRERIGAGRLDVGESVDLARQIAEGMAVAHAHGIVHRDLKPANIALTSEGRAKILDFGLARVLPRSKPDLDITLDTLPEGLTVSGTLDYLAPETLRHRPQGRLADIYALGVILFEMLTGTTPFGSVPLRHRIAAILDQDAPHVRGLRADVPLEVDQFIGACLQKHDRDRPPSMQLVVEELRRLQAKCCHERQPRTLAVLPFADMSPEQDQKYFCEGMTEDLIHTLNQMAGLRVVGRTSSAAWAENDGAPAVSAILEGSVRRHRERLRVMARLVDPQSGLSLWSGRYDRDSVDVLEVQGELAESIAEALEGALAPSGVAGSSDHRPDFSAYDDYLRGRSLLYQYRRRSVEQALAMFAKAVEHDPEYALAYAGMSSCYCFLYLYVDGRSGTLEEAQEASRRAIELDPQLAEAHAARGQALSLAGNHAEAEESFRNAMSLAPSQFDAYYWYARDSFAQGKLELAAVQFEQARLVAPDDYQAPLLVAQIYDRLGRDADAERSRRDGVRIVEERLRSAPGDVRALYMGANGLVALGRVEEGLEWAATARFMEPEEPMVLYNVACVYALAGELDDAMDLLEDAVHRGLMQKAWIVNDSNLDGLRSRSRYQELLNWLDRNASESDRD
jgi:serine/threonine protein kinase/Tfp pilus assembly protein PilF